MDKRISKTEAHANITTKFRVGLISEAEARRAHGRLNRIAASDRSWGDKKALYAVWAA